MINNKLPSQGEIVGHYLLNQTPAKESVNLFAESLLSLNQKVNNYDERLFNFIDRHHWSIGLIDSGVAVLRPDSEVRHRIYLMLAILEVNPKYNRRFLPARKNKLYFFAIVFICIKSVVETILGMILVKMVGWGTSV